MPDREKVTTGCGDVHVPDLLLTMPILCHLKCKQLLSMLCFSESLPSHSLPKDLQPILTLGAKAAVGIPLIESQPEEEEEELASNLAATSISSIVPQANPALAHNRSAALSQLPVLEGDDKVIHIPLFFSNIQYDEKEFPIGKYDMFKQQLDLRKKNSWTMKLDEVGSIKGHPNSKVPTIEVIEVHAINSIAPFILCSKLKPLMLQSPEVLFVFASSHLVQQDKWVINVSAMEGKFYRHKTEFHPHTKFEY